MTELHRAGWYRDPTERHEARFFDGDGWTGRARDGLEEMSDALPAHASAFLPLPHGDPIAVSDRRTVGEAGRRSVTDAGELAIAGGADARSEPVRARNTGFSRRSVALIVLALVVAVVAVGGVLVAGAGGTHRGGSNTDLATAPAAAAGPTRASVLADMRATIDAVPIAQPDTACAVQSAVHFCADSRAKIETWKAFWMRPGELSTAGENMRLGTMSTQREMRSAFDNYDSMFQECAYGQWASAAYFQSEGNGFVNIALARDAAQSTATAPPTSGVCADCTGPAPPLNEGQTGSSSTPTTVATPATADNGNDTCSFYIAHHIPNPCYQN